MKCARPAPDECAMVPSIRDLGSLLCDVAWRERQQTARQRGSPQETAGSAWKNPPPLRSRPPTPKEISSNGLTLRRWALRGSGLTRFSFEDARTPGRRRAGRDERALARRLMSAGRSSDARAGEERPGRRRGVCLQNARPGAAAGRMRGGRSVYSRAVAAARAAGHRPCARWSAIGRMAFDEACIWWVRSSF